MITPAYARTMAAYNAEMNRRLYAAAGRLDDAARKAERGAFFGSIHKTLCHLLWGDRMWMSRFADWDRPPVGIAGGVALFDDFAAMAAARVADDARLEAWAAGLTDEWLAGDLTWFSGALGRELTRPRAILVAHMFNHQTHHRGQVHAMLTAAGERTGDTDLPFILP